MTTTRFITAFTLLFSLVYSTYAFPTETKYLTHKQVENLIASLQAIKNSGLVFNEDDFRISGALADQSLIETDYLAYLRQALPNHEVMVKHHPNREKINKLGALVRQHKFQHEIDWARVVDKVDEAFLSIEYEKLLAKLAGYSVDTPHTEPKNLEELAALLGPTEAQEYLALSFFADTLKAMLEGVGEIPETNKQIIEHYYDQLIEHLRSRD